MPTVGIIFFKISLIIFCTAVSRNGKCYLCNADIIRGVSSYQKSHSVSVPVLFTQRSQVGSFLISLIRIFRPYEYGIYSAAGYRVSITCIEYSCISVSVYLIYSISVSVTFYRISAVFHNSNMISRTVIFSAIEHYIARLCGFNLNRPCFQQCISESTASRIRWCNRHCPCLTGNSGNIHNEIGTPRLTAGIPSGIIIFPTVLCHSNIDHIHSAVTCQCNRIKAILNAVIRTCGKCFFKRRDIVAQRCSDRSKSHYRRNNSRCCSFQLHRNLSL